MESLLQAMKFILGAGDFAWPSVPIGPPNDSSIGSSTKITISGIFSHGAPMSRPTAGVTGAGVGLDSVWEQEKLEVRKMLDCPKGVPHAGFL